MIDYGYYLREIVPKHYALRPSYAVPLGILVINLQVIVDLPIREASFFILIPDQRPIGLV